jgi:hypothetical protein
MKKILPMNLRQLEKHSCLTRLLHDYYNDLRDERARLASAFSNDSVSMQELSQMVILMSLSHTTIHYCHEKNCAPSAPFFTTANP